MFIFIAFGSNGSLYKTKECKLWTQGKCDKNPCNYAHGVDELRRKQDKPLDKTKKCKFFEQGRCDRNPCNYAHNEPELHQEQDKSKYNKMNKYNKNRNWFYGKGRKYLHNGQKSNELCRFYTTPSGCKNGENCKYIHKKGSDTVTRINMKR